MGEDSSRGTLEEFFSPSFCSTKLTLGLLRDQRAQRALNLAVHSGWSPSCRKGKYKAMQTHFLFISVLFEIVGVKKIFN